MQKRQSNMLTSMELFLFSNPAVIELVACQLLCRKLSIYLGSEFEGQFWRWSSEYYNILFCLVTDLDLIHLYTSLPWWHLLGEVKIGEEIIVSWEINSNTYYIVFNGSLCKNSEL